jgi:hypothetical protein
MWFKSHLVTLKEDNNLNLKTSVHIKDYIIFEYTFGGYMDMISLSIPVLTDNFCLKNNLVICNGETTEQRIFYIGYEVEANSGKFFVYSKMKAQDGEIRFSTFLGKNPCRFIVFTNESNIAFAPNNKKIKILDSRENIDYIFEAMPWQKLGEKIFSSIRVDEDNNLIPYKYIAQSFGGQCNDF